LVSGDSTEYTVDDLDERQKTILSSVIKEYIATVAPVSSKLIAERCSLGVSPATVRNEMASLEEQGYLTHPHTSAGRVPTEKGYRYFVQRLMDEVELAPQERRTIRHQFHQVRLDLDQWLRLSAAVLAQTAQTVSLVTAPRASRYLFKHLELVSIRDDLALLILVLHGSVVKQQLFALDTPLSQDELSVIARRLTDLWDKKEVHELGATLETLSPFEQTIAEVVYETMLHVEARMSGDVYHDGLLNILRQPEFSQGRQAEQIIRVLEERSLIESLLNEVLHRGGVQVIIGGEELREDLSECGIVVARYGDVDEVSGALGVLGPMRMAYGRAVSIVRYMAELMSDLIDEVY
jgi:heat-inducible transcriptional repressor